MMQTQRMSPGADVCEKSIRTKSEDVDNDLDFGFISIHAPRVGSDGPVRCRRGSRRKYFNPRSPCGERHPRPSAPRCSADFNPRSPCGERPYKVGRLCGRMAISIHAPRVGSDLPQSHPIRPWTHFNPRSPCGERQTGSLKNPTKLGFQSTLPVWGATAQLIGGIYGDQISIHAPRVGSDPVTAGAISSGPYFNPRSPCGERQRRSSQAAHRCHFNPRSPCGERQTGTILTELGYVFQSTLPVWGATSTLPPQNIEIDISIHAPRVGSDALQTLSADRERYFNPRSPCGERPA